MGLNTTKLRGCADRRPRDRHLHGPAAVDIVSAVHRAVDLHGVADALEIPVVIGGAALVGVNGVCMISHGSSSANAILNAARAANELAETDLVGQLVAALAAD